ncbi:tetratricopeptide repeat protein [Gammaproteobacteria bacterium]|nr:tetratricopeptide repeat protein [Gammaproteobacteria bacterium]
MNFRFLFFKFIAVFLFLPIFVSANVNDDAKTDILFLKIQELELEIAELRNRLESQDYLIEKLIAESSSVNDEGNSEKLEDLTLNADIRFAGIEDPKSKDQIYNAAIEALEDQNFEKSFNLFKYFVESFSDEEKTPLSYFWLGEISLIGNDLENASTFFMELISLYPNHYRVPLSHKKIGDIYLKSNDIKKAKDKYNFVVREYPNNTASSLALQLLKNME